VGVKVLVVDDERNLVNLLRGYMEREGFEMHAASDGPTAIDEARRVEPEVVVLDWMLPGQDGVEVLRDLRRFTDAYVLMLTARSEETDRIMGLSAGADDYVTKPFSPDELVARIRAMLRRPRGEAEEETAVPARFGGLVVDAAGHTVSVDGEEAGLTAIEFELLRVLSSRPGFVFSRSRLLERVWGDSYYGSDHVVDVHVANLRQKIEPAPSNPVYVQTVRGVGYRFAHAREG
jgi:DNA-binding response OmpR family regulator